MDLIKYDMTDIWASAGDVVAPDSAKINQGWGVEVVPRQWWNWFENRQDQNIAYMLQKGFPEWDSTTQYIINKSYVQRNGVVYKATATSTNSDPIALTSWVRAFTDHSNATSALVPLAPVNGSMVVYTGSNSAQVFTTNAFGRGFLTRTDAATGRTYIDAQQANTNLTALSGVTAATNALPYFTSTTAMGVTTLTSFGRSLLDDNDATAARATLGLGTAATATLTTSTTDSTFGRVLKVGDFGLGYIGATVPTADLNDLGTASGFYGINSGTANQPIGSGSGSNCIHTSFNIDNIQQTVLGRNSDQVWHRRKTAGVWQPWVEEWNTANLVKTTSTMDSTAGSMLKVGDFGLGSLVAPPSIPDLTINIPVGFYFVPTNSTGAPTTSAGYLTVTMYAHCTFVVATAPIANRKIWDGVRNATTGAWTWTEVVHDGNLAAITSDITSDVTASIQPSLDLKQNISTLGVETSGSAEDPNTSLNVTFLTNHANGPQANGGFNGFWHIQQQFYQSKADTNRSRSQIAVTYNASTPQMWIRSGYTATPGSVAPTWYPWVRCDMGGNAATATKLATARTINGVSFDGSANISIPIEVDAGGEMNIGKHLDFRDTGSVANADVRVSVMPGLAPFTANQALSVNIGAAGTSNGIIQAGHYICNGGFFRSIGNGGWYSETWGGGINMTDATWVRVYNGKSFFCSATVQATSFVGNGASITGISADNITVTQSQAATGYVVLPGGTILQWGPFSTATSYTFPTAFPTACRAITTGQNGRSSGSIERMGISSFTTTGFAMQGAIPSGGLPASWMAIGY